MKTQFLRINFLLLMVYFIQTILMAQVANVSLKYKKIKLPTNTYNVAEIIDARTNKDFIGLIYDAVDMPGIKKKVNFQAPLNIEMNSLFEEQNSANPLGTPLYITVNNLIVSDNEGVNKLYRLLEINMDFYIKENDVYYLEFSAGKYITSTQNPATQKIDNMIAEAITNCYSEFLYRISNKLGYHKEVTYEEMKQNSQNNQVQNESFALKGKNRIFYTFNMFRDNMADTETQFLLKNLNSAKGI